MAKQMATIKIDQLGGYKTYLPKITADVQVKRGAAVHGDKGGIIGPRGAMQEIAKQLIAKMHEVSAELGGIRPGDRENDYIAYLETI